MPFTSRLYVQIANTVRLACSFSILVPSVTSQNVLTWYLPTSLMRLALVSTQLLLTQALQLAPGVKPRLATGGLTVLTPAAAHAASATYDFGYRLERSLDPDKRGPSDDSAVSDILASMCNPPMPEAADPAPALALTDAAASGIASSTALAAQPAMVATAGSAKVAANPNPNPNPI